MPMTRIKEIADAHAQIAKAEAREQNVRDVAMVLAFAGIESSREEILAYLDSIVVTCACGNGYTPETWSALPSLGRQAIDPDETDTFGDVRNCTCGSTLVLDVRTLPDEEKKP